MVSEPVQPATWDSLRVFFVGMIIVDYAVSDRFDCCMKVIMVGGRRGSRRRGARGGGATPPAASTPQGSNPQGGQQVLG
jgi:hypothetical protein